MTEIAQTVATLPHQAKTILVQLWQAPGVDVPAAIPSALGTLLAQGLVNATDGRLSITQRGKNVLRYLETDRHIATCDRFLNLVSNVLACDGRVAGLEQTFCDEFTPDELDLLAGCVEQLRAALNSALEAAGE